MDFIGSLDLEPGRPNGLKQKLENLCILKSAIADWRLLLEPERSLKKKASFSSNFLFFHYLYKASILTLAQVQIQIRVGSGSEFGRIPEFGSRFREPGSEKLG